MTEIELVGIDADDTLWQSETFFAEVEEKFTELMVSTLLIRVLKSPFHLMKSPTFGFWIWS
ncbi:MAG: hypothetical protein CM15mP49_12980 [Actinomycetota bacterium]|nr:MAG: hypothetical protein CM15mP49_12980 [Actinomycetota bacterium]